MPEKPLIMIGLDGASLNILGLRIDNGRLPNFQKIVESGISSD